MPVAQHSIRQWNWSVPEEEKNQIKPIFIDKQLYKVTNTVAKSRYVWKLSVTKWCCNLTDKANN